MTPEEAKQWIDVARYALDTLWPYLVALGIVAPLASKRIRAAAAGALSDTLSKHKNNHPEKQ